MPLRIVQFHAIILTALALIPGGAHLFELPNKIGLHKPNSSPFSRSIAAGRCSESS